MSTGRKETISATPNSEPYGTISPPARSCESDEGDAPTALSLLFSRECRFVFRTDRKRGHAYMLCGASKIGDHLWGRQELMRTLRASPRPRQLHYRRTPPSQDKSLGV